MSHVLGRPVARNFGSNFGPISGPVILAQLSRHQYRAAMRTLDDVIDQFGYHPATRDTAVVHDLLRRKYIEHAAVIWDSIPDGPEKTVAMRKLQESLMYANLAVAITAPVDTKDSATARVLPTERGH